MPDVPEMDAPVTRRELHEALETWAGAIIAQVTTQVTAQVTTQVTTQVTAQVRAMFDAFEDRWKAELRMQIRGSESELATRLVAVDQQYQDLPLRVTRLEAKVFAPPRRKRRAQRSR